MNCGYNILINILFSNYSLYETVLEVYLHVFLEKNCGPSIVKSMVRIMVIIYFRNTLYILTNRFLYIIHYCKKKILSKPVQIITLYSCYF